MEFFKNSEFAYVKGLNRPETANVRLNQRNNHVES